MSITIWKYVIFGCAVITAYALLQIWFLEQAEKKKSAEKAAMSGTITPPKSKKKKSADSARRIGYVEKKLDSPFEPELDDPFEPEQAHITPPNSTEVAIIVGTNTFKVPRSRFGNDRPFLITDGTMPPVYIKLKNDTIQVWGTFISTDGKIVAEIIANEWQVNPNNYFKRNYDKNGFEVIDSEGFKYQIEYLDRATIQFSGFFKSQSAYYKISPDTGIEVYDIKSITTARVKQLNEEVPTLFKYPADKYHGVRK